MTNFADTGSLGCYLYGVRAASTVPTTLGPGIDPAFDVVGRCYGSLEVLCSKVRLNVFDRRELEGADLAWLLDRVRDHDRLIRAATDPGPLIPFRFATVLEREELAVDMLRLNQPAFRSTLSELAGKREWGLRILSLAKRAGKAREPTVPPRSGKEYLMGKRRQLADRQNAQAGRQDWIRRQHECLGALAHASALLPLTRDLQAPAEPTVHNGAYLVADVRLKAFRELVREMSLSGQALDLEVRLTGPWPAYSFANLNLLLPRPDERSTGR